MPIGYGALISAGLGLAGDVMSAQSAGSINQKTMNFDALMQQRQQSFAQSQMNQAEAYNTQMSDTAIQRRVADLKAAGINPMLAAGGAIGGATAPTITPQGISAPSASLQNPGSAYANLGGQVAGSISSVGGTTAQNILAGAQARLATANAVNQEQQNPYSGKIAAQTAENLIKQQDILDQNYENLKLDWDIKSSDSLVEFMKGLTAMQQYQFKEQLYPLLLDLQNIDNTAASNGLPATSNDAAHHLNWWGRTLDWLGFGGGGGAASLINSASSAARAAAELAP